MRSASILLLTCTLSLATTLKRATTRDLVREAQRVCCVRVESVEARLDARSGFVFTHVKLRCLEDLKGKPEGPTLELRFVGGESANVRTVVAGMPRLRKGEECVVFLGARSRQGPRVLIHAGRAVMHVRKDKQGRRHVASRVTGFDLDDTSLDAFRGAVLRDVRERRK